MYHLKKMEIHALISTKQIQYFEPMSEPMSGYYAPKFTHVGTYSYKKSEGHC